MKFRGKELADAYQAKRDVEEKDKVRFALNNVVMTYSVVTHFKSIRFQNFFGVRLDVVFRWLSRTDLL